MTKNIKRNYIFAICVLSILLAISAIYNFMGGFKFDNLMNLNAVVGDDVIIKLNSTGAQSKALAISGASLPNDTIKQNIQITLPNIDTTNLVLRGKVLLGDGNVAISGFDLWKLDENDNYYYFKDQIYQNQTVGMASEIKLADEISLNKNKIYYVNIIVELFYAEGLNL